mgnify:CR=1 FL=1
MPDSNSAIDIFDQNAKAYEQFRPNCPIVIVDTLQQWSDLSARDKVLEIGSGTGQLTRALADWNNELVALEKGIDLARLARAKFLPSPEIKVITADFETWKSNESFQLITACQSFHWISMAKGFEKVYELLGPGGKLALIWHLDISQNTPFWQKTSPIYKEFFPSSEKYTSLAEQVDRHQSYLQKSPLFLDCKRLEHPWDIEYSKANYLGLLGTFSTQSKLSPSAREQFFLRIGQAIDELGGRIIRKHKTVMLFAQKQ